MSGLVGFTRLVAGDHEPLAVLGGMRAMLTHYPHERQDSLWSTGGVYATRVTGDAAMRAPQPFVHQGIYAWVDGVIYNRPELAARGQLPDPESDGDLLAQLWNRDGNRDFLRHIDGHFAAVIYDSARGQLHITADRFGLRRMHWTCHQGGLWWSSEVKPILALPGYSARIDRQTARDFTATGNVYGEHTWFEGIQRLKTGTILTWDLPSATLSQRRYWWWSDIAARTDPIKLDDAADELGHRLIRAVERRAAKPRVNIELSGGVDSRSILGAIPADREVHAYTSGQAGCDDILLAARAAQVRRAAHHIYEVSGANWLNEDTLLDIWRMDGESGIAQVVGSRAHGSFLDDAPERLNGAGGNMGPGATRLRADTLDRQITRALMADLLHYDGFDVDLTPYATLPKVDFVFIDNRSRRYNVGTVHASRTHGEVHMPWYDNDVVEFLYSLPDTLRYRRRLYNHMMLRFFPDYFRTIPWKYSGAPIGTPPLSYRLRNLPNKARRVFFQYTQKLGWTEYKHNNPRYQMLDAPRWIRQEPGRGFFDQLLLNPRAIYPDYISRETVVDQLRRHQRGENHAPALLYYATTEIWLQQVLEGRYRAPTPASPGA